MAEEYEPINPELVKYLRRSLRLDTAIDEDPAYEMDAEEIEGIVKFAIESIDPQYSLESFPDKLRPVIILLSKKEVYWRLATATAPLYPLQAEGAGLQQNIRFDHYLSLIQQVEQEIESTYGDLLKSLNYPDIADSVGEIIKTDNYYTRRNYNLASAPKAKLEIDEIYPDKVEFSWEQFDQTNEDGIFSRYNIYLSTESILDFYADDPLKSRGKRRVMIRDIHRTKYRLSNLESDTTYYLTLEVKNYNSLAGYSEVTFTTKAEES